MMGLARPISHPKPSGVMDDPLLAGVPLIQGQKVLDPAVLIRRMGDGAMAAVYLGVHLRLNIPVAVKVLKPSAGEGAAKAAERFCREAEHAARLSDPRIVRVYDSRAVANTSETSYLVMEYVDGETLEARVRRKQRLGGREAASIAYHAAGGVRVAHREKLIHRDIKPGNILVSRGGEVKLADFGIVKAADPSTTGLTAAHLLLGTPQYMAPELWRGAVNASFASDIYALGATLAFMLSGRHLLGLDAPADVMRRAIHDGFPLLMGLVPGVDPALADLVRRMTDRNPSQRPTIESVERDLRNWLASRGGLFPLEESSSATAVIPQMPDPKLLQAIRDQLAGSIARQPAEATPQARTRPQHRPAVGARVPASRKPEPRSGLVPAWDSRFDPHATPAAPITSFGLVSPRWRRRRPWWAWLAAMLILGCVAGSILAADDGLRGKVVAWWNLKTAP